MNKITIIGIIMSIVGVIGAFACIACSTPWPIIIFSLIGGIGIAFVCDGVKQGNASIKRSDGTKITITENNERILKSNGFCISKVCKFAAFASNSKKYSALYIDDKNYQWAICYYNSSQFK